MTISQWFGDMYLPPLTMFIRNLRRRHRWWWSQPWLILRSPIWPHFGTTPRLSWFPQPLVKSLQLFRVWKKIIQSAKTGSFKHLTVKEAVLNGLVATEVWMWFYIGEIIGKRGIVGYDVWRPIFNFWFEFFFECSWTMCKETAIWIKY